jgi:hypothetical protein
MVKRKNGEAKTSGDANSDSIKVTVVKKLKDNHLFAMPPIEDSFELWHQQRKFFLVLSFIDTVLDEDDRPAYQVNFLLSCLSSNAIVTQALSDSTYKI